ncbi:MAG: hypothetical protein LUD16_07635 [Lachnospiraceae bacterium]|nr:hypothetical protein [Lachnospiraceae bacterium]
MSTRTVKEGNAYYEIDEDCMKQLEAEKNHREDKSSRKQPVRHQSDARRRREMSQSITME